MNYSFHPGAEEELGAAIDYYQECEAGLGYDLSLEVFAAIVLAVMHSRRQPDYSKNR